MKWKRAIVAAVLTCTVTAALICALSGPTLVETYLVADLFGTVGDPPFTVLNPIRDRGSEHEADALLASLASGSCDQLKALNPNGIDIETVCAGERENPLVDWTRYSRVDRGNKATITYWPIRKDRKGYAPPVLVIVERTGAGYQVVGFRAAY